MMTFHCCSIHARAVRRAQSSLSYRRMWIIIASGFFDPVFYLFGLGFGLGALIGDVEYAGQMVSMPPSSPLAWWPRRR